MCRIAFREDIYLGTWASPPQCVELWFESLPTEMLMIVSRIGLFPKKYVFREAKKKVCGLGHCFQSLLLWYDKFDTIVLSLLLPLMLDS